MDQLLFYQELSSQSSLYSRISFEVAGPQADTRMQRLFYNSYITVAGHTQSSVLSPLGDSRAPVLMDVFQITEYHDDDSIFNVLKWSTAPDFYLQTITSAVQPDFLSNGSAPF